MNKYQPTDFKWRHFHGEVIMQCVRWYCKYGISYRDLEEMMTERGLTIINTHINPAYNQAINALKKEGNLAEHVRHLQIKYRCMAIVIKSLLLMNNLVYTVKLFPKSLVLHLAYYVQRSHINYLTRLIIHE